jgi:DNA-binding transcriptional regulator PaaX
VNTWLQLIYKIPRNPTSRRVYVWRKLKRLGAILLQDAVWILPKNPWTLEQFEWLVVEIKEMDGEASLWESKVILGQDSEILKQKFIKLVDEDYHKLLDEMNQQDADLVSLTKRYQQIKMKDYFESRLGDQIKESLIKARAKRSEQS